MYCAKLSIHGLTTAAMSQSHEVSDDLGGHHISLEDLKKSAETCPLCRLFILALDDLDRDSSGRAVRQLANASKGDDRFKIWARNTDLNNRVKEDEALTRLVLQWVGNSGEPDNIELLLFAPTGKLCNQLLAKIQEAQLQKVAQLQHTSIRILQSVS